MIKPLRRAAGSNTHNGPAVLALLAGVHVNEAARVLRRVSGRPHIRGVSADTLRAGLADLGYKSRRLVVDANALSTVARVVAEYDLVEAGGPSVLLLIANAGAEVDRFIAVDGGRLYDHEHGGGVSLAVCPYNRRRVLAGWEVFPDGNNQAG